MNTSAFKINLPLRAGVSLKPQHFQFILEHLPNVGFFEVHSENYMSPGGLHLDYLEKICQHYPLSLHGVGLSLGSANGINEQHVKHLAELVKRFEPAQVSEHVSWSQWHELFVNDLLPLPYTRESLQVLAQNIEKVQEALQRPILIENPSAYISFKQQEYSEPEFLNRLCERSGCGLLLDLNNIVVSAFNNESNTPAKDYLKGINTNFIGEIHLAGHKTTTLNADKKLKIDDHGSQVADEVWSLLKELIAQHQLPLPLLVEWDTDVPDFSVLHEEANKAETILQKLLINTSKARPC